MADQQDRPFAYEHLVIDIPDYPEPGVIFKDITPLISNEHGLSACVDTMVDHFLGMGINKVVGSEARGFLIGAPVAYRLGAGFVPARKPGKLPREVYSQRYALEYGTDELQIHMGFSFILELDYLHPREVISKEFPQEIFSLIKVH